MSETRASRTPASVTGPVTAPVTLKRVLAARWAQDMLADLPELSALPSEPASAPRTDDALLTEAVRAVAQLDLPPEKLALLRASLGEFDATTAARRLTSTQARDVLAPASRRAPRAPQNADDALTVEALDALTPDAWAEFTRWLLEQGGARIEPRPFAQREGLVAWRAEQGERRLVLCAWRVAPVWPLLEDDLRRMAALAAGEPGTHLVVVTTAEATVGARLAAQTLSQTLGEARVIDRLALAETLGRLTTAYQREQDRSHDEAKARAKAASAARKKLLAALTALDEQAQAKPSAQKVAGRAAVRKAATQVEQAHRLAAQALIAWETLLADWAAAFDERPARAGSLTFTAEPAAYGALAERADHLKKPLLDALRALAKTAGEGDLGYTAWRLALGEELAARCSALRWHAQQIDPAKWEDFAEATSDLALQEASRAENAARHAAARAGASRSQLIERIGAL